jgi:hypothetical protein
MEGHGTATRRRRDLDTHRTIAGAASLVLSVPVLLLGLFVFLASLVGAGAAEAFGDVPGLGALIGTAGLLIGLVIAAFGVPGTVAGAGLLLPRPWAKPWTVAAAVLSLFNIPLGTAFAVYAFWLVSRPGFDDEVDPSSRPP